MLAVFFILVLILVISRNLLLMLIVLEILGFVMVYYSSLHFSLFSSSDYMVLLLFSVLVMEGVIALSGLISLVSYSGSDYLVSSSLLKI